MEFPKLKPPEKYSKHQSVIDKDKEGSFAHRFQSIMKSYFESKSPAQSKNSNSSNRGKKRHVLQSIPIIMICEVRLIRRYSHLLLHVME